MRYIERERKREVHIRTSVFDLRKIYRRTNSSILKKRNKKEEEEAII